MHVAIKSDLAKAGSRSRLAVVRYLGVEQHAESQAGMMDDVDINMPIADVAAMLLLLELRSSRFVLDFLASDKIGN